MKLFKMILFLLSLVLLATGCQKSPEEQLIGSWETSDCCETLVFNNQGQVIFNDYYLGEYAVYDNNKIIINVDTELFDNAYDINLSGTFEVEDNKLKIYDSTNSILYRYYSSGNVSSLFNKDYFDQYYTSEIETYLSYPISYPDDWTTSLNGTELEGLVDTNTLKQNWITAENILESEVLKIYKNGSFKNESISYKCINASLLWDEICYTTEISVSIENLGTAIFTYAICPLSGNIYIENSDGFFTLWDGNLPCNHMLEIL